MKTKFKYNHWLFKIPPMNNYGGITLGRYILFRDSKEQVPELLVKHELVHQEQMERDGIIKFYLKYVWDYLKNLIKYRNHWEAYFNIPYEKEAYIRMYE